MATYTVNITGNLNSSYAYATLNGTNTTTTGTNTYTSKPTIAVYVSSPYSSVRTMCKVTLNGTTVKSGYGSYTVDIGDADAVNIQFNIVDPNGSRYYTCDITTEVSDPMAPHDGHNTNIGQVARQIEGGTVRLGGIGREIESGLVLAGGVAREIAFGGGLPKLTIKGSGDANNCYVKVGGSSGELHYTEKTIEVEAGTVLYCRIASTSSSGAKITLNGTSVGSGTSAKTYNYTIQGNVTVSFNYDGHKGSIDITEE